MMRQWHDDLEAEILIEIEHTPDHNTQMATDILYAFEFQPEAMVHLVSDALRSANDTLVGYMDNFLNDVTGFNIVIEFSSVTLNHYGSVCVNFTIVPPDVIRIWYDDPNRQSGGLYALI